MQIYRCIHLNADFTFEFSNSDCKYILFFLLQLEMEDGDEIDAMLHQTGGAFA